MLKEALGQYGIPDIINSDQGSQFTSALWTAYVEKDLEGQTRISMDGKGRAIDNIFIERFWRTLKQDYVYLSVPANGTELYHGLCSFIDYYNHEKTHQGINRKTPASLYKRFA